MKSGHLQSLYLSPKGGREAARGAEGPPEMAAAVPHRGCRGAALLHAPWGKWRKPEEKEEAGDIGAVGGGHMGSIWGAFSAEVCFFTSGAARLSCYLLRADAPLECAVVSSRPIEKRVRGKKGCSARVQALHYDLGSKEVFLIKQLANPEILPLPWRAHGL